MRMSISTQARARSAKRSVIALTLGRGRAPRRFQRVGPDGRRSIRRRRKRTSRSPGSRQRPKVAAPSAQALAVALLELVDERDKRDEEKAQHEEGGEHDGYGGIAREQGRQPDD